MAILFQLIQTLFVINLNNTYVCYVIYKKSK